MTMKRILLAAIAGFVLAGSGALAAQPADDDAVLQQLELTWVHATATGDRAELAKVLDDSYIETNAKGQRRSKSDVLSASPLPPGSTQTLIDLDVHVTGDTAVVTGTNRLRISASEVPQNFAFTDVFVRQNGTWRATASHLSRN